VGQLVIGVLAALGLLLLSYLAGEQRGYRQGRQALSRTLPPSLAMFAAPAPAPSKPAGDPTPATPTHAQTPAATPSAPATDPIPLVTQASASGQSLVWVVGPGEDGRVSGLWYFVLLHSNREYAQRVMTYLAQQGVETQAIQSHNDRLVRVMPLQGFTDEERRENTPGFLEFQRRIKLLGRQWQAAQRSARAWEDLYPSQYQGAGAAAVLRITAAPTDSTDSNTPNAQTTSAPAPTTPTTPPTTPAAKPTQPQP
jgi:hypothetical protein